MDARIFPLILGFNSLLHGFREGVNGQTRLLFSRNPAHSYTISADFHRSLRAGEDQSLALFAAIHKIDSEAQIESFTIIEQAQHDVWCVATIIPETNRTGGHALRGPVGTGDE